MTFFFVDPEVYKKHRDKVLELSDSYQIDIHEFLPAEKRTTPLSDAQIAEKLGLDERTVREIRVVAERDAYGLDEWEKAIEFKKKACEEYAKKGVSYATRKYVEKRKESGKKENES